MYNVHTHPIVPICSLSTADGARGNIVIYYGVIKGGEGGK